MPIKMIDKWMQTVEGRNWPAFLAEAMYTKLGKTKTTIAPHNAPVYRIMLPMEGMKMANKTQMVMRDALSM